MTIQIIDAVTKVWGLFSNVMYYHIVELPQDHELRNTVPGAQYLVTMRIGTDIPSFPLSDISTLEVQQR